MHRSRNARSSSGTRSRLTRKGRYVDEAGYNQAMDVWNEGREKHEQEQRGSAGRVAEAIVSGAITVAGAYGSPEQSSTDTTNNWGESRQQEGSDRRSREIRGGTRDKGRRTGGSSKNR